MNHKKELLWSQAERKKSAETAPGPTFREVNLETLCSKADGVCALLSDQGPGRPSTKQHDAALGTMLLSGTR